jgi:putative flippase GtrA
VGCVAILAREAIAAQLPADTPVYYTLSVALVYAGGILASYYGHRKVTFRDTSVSGRVFKSFRAFVLIAIFGMLATASLSILFRYGIPVQAGRFQPGLAFALATLTTSLLTYRLNKYFAFGPAREDCRQEHEASSRT